MLLSPPVPIPDTLKGIDDLIRIDFEGFRAVWFARLLVATFLVVVGLAMEGPELWHEIHSIIWHWNFKRRFHFSLPDKHPPEWAKLLAFVGWMFIVAGVAGEFVADSFVSRADGLVQKFDEILLADAQKKTGAASERAARAFERAAQTEQEASQENERAARAEQQATEENARAAKALEAAEIARKDAEGLQLQIAQANERAGEANERASASEKEAANLRLQVAEEQVARLKLEEIILPRTLTPDQRKVLLDKLKPLKGKRLICSYLLTEQPDSLAFGSLLCATLKQEAEILVEEKPEMIFGGVQAGLGITTGGNRTDDANTLFEALKDAGLMKGPRQFSTSNRPDDLKLFVGPKHFP
jgi:hypothetical protein